MSELRKQLEAAECSLGKLQAEVLEVRDGNSRLKQEYDALLREHHAMDEKFREEKMQGTELLEDMIRQKQLAAARMNSKNEKRVRYVTPPQLPLCCSDRAVTTITVRPVWGGGD